MKLDPHQEEAVEWLLAHPRGGLADEMRVGKTAPTIVATAEVGAKRILVLCPAMARTVWHQAVKDWYTGDDGEWIILSYNSFAMHLTVDQRIRQDEIRDWRPDTLILDECHALKNRKSRRTRAVYGQKCRGGGDSLVHAAERVWLLSGTLMPNGVHELWTHWRALFHTPLTYRGWMQRYCITRQDRPYGDPTVIGLNKMTAPELRSMLRDKFLRRTFKQVHPRGSGPPLIWNVVPLDLDMDEQLSRLSVDAKKLLASPGHARLMKRLRRAEKEGRVLERSRKDIEEPLATLRRLTAEVKGYAVGSHCIEWLEANPKRSMLVLGYHREALAFVAERISRADHNVGMILGGMGDKKRDAVIEAFRTGDVRVIVGQIGACGMAIDLSRAGYVVFAETVWTPGDNVQAAMRSQHREKKGAVPVDVLVLPGSIDEAVERVKVRKLRMLSAIQDDIEPNKDEEK